MNKKPITKLHRRIYTGWTEKAAKLCSLSNKTVSMYANCEGAPREPLCFWLWYLAREKRRADWRRGSRDRINARVRVRMAQVESVRTDNIDRCRAYRKANRAAIAAKRKLELSKRRNLERARCRSDVVFRLRRNLRSRFSKALKLGRGKKHEGVLILTGCTLEFLKAHIESQFKEGMSWDNYGEWHIDHRKPLASFDLLDPEQQRIAFHWTNLQPLWGMENILKGARAA